ncbi:drug/metabolite transporter permease [Pseudomonas aeruginosa]|nr:drug/metabolite transporter permease [Pseudomonas aeruginosa]
MNLSLYLLTVLIWGTTWIAIKLQMGPVAITLSIAYRFALAALVLFAVLLLGRRLPKAGRTGPTPVHGPGRMPVLPEFHLLLYRQPVDSQRPGGRGVLHRHPVECAERPPVVRPAHRVET